MTLLLIAGAIPLWIFIAFDILVAVLVAPRFQFEHFVTSFSGARLFIRVGRRRPQQAALSRIGPRYPFMGRSSPVVPAGSLHAV